MILFRITLLTEKIYSYNINYGQITSNHLNLKFSIKKECIKINSY